MSSRPRVLIVDDVPDWRDLLAGRLRRDCDVEEAGSLREALNILMGSDNLFHLVVIDLSLKGAATDQQGLEIARYVRDFKFRNKHHYYHSLSRYRLCTPGLLGFSGSRLLEKTPAIGAV